jgi:hypothetical protein
MQHINGSGINSANRSTDHSPALGANPGAAAAGEDGEDGENADNADGPENADGDNAGEGDADMIDSDALQLDEPSFTYEDPARGLTANWDARKSFKFTMVGRGLKCSKSPGLTRNSPPQNPFIAGNTLPAPWMLLTTAEEIGTLLKSLSSGVRAIMGDFFSSLSSSLALP